MGLVQAASPAIYTINLRFYFGTMNTRMNRGRHDTNVEKPYQIRVPTI